METKIAMSIQAEGLLDGSDNNSDYKSDNNGNWREEEWKRYPIY